jgi:hypothetical protein
LLEVDNVVARRAVSLPVEPEVVTTQSCNKNTSQSSISAARTSMPFLPRRLHFVIIFGSSFSSD